MGIVLGSHGVNGALRVRVMSDVPYRFDPGQTLLVRQRSHRIRASSRNRADSVILNLEGIDTAPAARALIGQELVCNTEASPALPEDAYFHFQLLGLRVFTESGEDLGQIAEIIVTGSNDVYVVQGPGGEVLLPALLQVVRQVNLDKGTMTVRLLEGLR